MQSPPSNQSPRPRPVRQYTDGSSSRQESSSSQRPQISRAPREENKPAIVTHEELERLRQASRNNPSDSRTQLLLAKKLVEAASVLADEGGRADPRTSNRNRERFVSEAYKIVKKLAQNGYPEAMFYLGDCYSRGSLGLQTDAKEAFGYYQSAAKVGTLKLLTGWRFAVRWDWTRVVGLSVMLSKLCNGTSELRPWEILQRCTS